MLWSNVNLRGRTMGWRRRSADDFSEEIRAHIALETDRLIADGHETRRRRAPAPIAGSAT